MRVDLLQEVAQDDIEIVLVFVDERPGKSSPVHGG